MINISRLYWWNWTSNFGDALGPWIVNKLLCSNVPRAKDGDSDVLFAIGSIIHYSTKFRNVTVWGSGIEPHYGGDLSPDLRILALRGPLTAKLLKCSLLLTPFEILRLLLPPLHAVRPAPNDVAIIPHHAQCVRDGMIGSSVHFGALIT